MTANITIQRATINDAHEVAVMVGELLSEIMSTIGIQAFNFSLDETTARLKNFIDREKYFVFVAQSENAGLVGFIALYESHALYAEGAFGTTQSFLSVRDFAHKTWGCALWNRQRLSAILAAGSA